SAIEARAAIYRISHTRQRRSFNSAEISLEMRRETSERTGVMLACTRMFPSSWGEQQEDIHVPKRFLILGLVALATLDTGASAQNTRPMTVRPMFVTLPNHTNLAPRGLPPAVQLTQWNGSFTDLTGKHVSYVMAGTNPSTTNTTTTIPVYVIPI